MIYEYDIESPERNAELSSYKKFFQLSVSTGNILTSDYGRVSKTKIGYKRVYETRL